LRGEPLGDLLLHHHDIVLDLRGTLQQPEEDRDGDVVREVPDDAPPIPREELVPWSGKRVGLEHLYIREVRDDLAEGGDERPIELHCENVRTDVGCPLREWTRERAESGADLEDAISRRDLRCGHDRLRQVGVRQEVLAEILRGPDPVALRQLAEVSDAESRDFATR
jgi:hypothetical protein